MVDYKFLHVLLDHFSTHINKGLVGMWFKVFLYCFTLNSLAFALSADVPRTYYPEVLLNKKDKEIALIDCTALTSHSLNCVITKLKFRESSNGVTYREFKYFWEELLSAPLVELEEVFQKNGKIRPDYNEKYCSNLNNIKKVFEAIKGSKIAKQELFSSGTSRDKFEMFLKRDPREVHYFTQSLGAFIRMCDEPNRENFKLLTLDQFERDLATCTPRMTRRTFSFLKSSEDLWYHTTEPEPDDKCETITRRTISAKQHNWSYSEKSKSLLIEDNSSECKEVNKEKLYLRDFSPSFFGCDFMQ